MLLTSFRGAKRGKKNELGIGQTTNDCFSGLFLTYLIDLKETYAKEGCIYEA